MQIYGTPQTRFNAEQPQLLAIAKCLERLVPHFYDEKHFGVKGKHKVKK